MVKKNKDDKEIVYLGRILNGLSELCKSTDLKDMVECFDDLVINNKKYAHIENTVTMNNKEYAKMIRIIDQVAEKSEDKNG